MLIAETLVRTRASPVAGSGAGSRRTATRRGPSNHTESRSAGEGDPVTEAGPRPPRQGRASGRRTGTPGEHEVVIETRPTESREVHGRGYPGQGRLAADQPGGDGDHDPVREPFRKHRSEHPAATFHEQPPYAAAVQGAHHGSERHRAFRRAEPQHRHPGRPKARGPLARRLEAGRHEWRGSSPGSSAAAEKPGGERQPQPAVEDDRQGLSPATSLTVSRGSSASTVPIPTRIASWPARSRWVSSSEREPLSRSGSPGLAAMEPSRLWA